MQILNFLFLTIHCYGITDNDEVNYNLCVKGSKLTFVFCVKKVLEKAVKAETGGKYH